MAGRPVPVQAVVLVVGALVALSLYLTARTVALAGDGAFYLIQIVADGDWFGRGARTFSNYVRETPAVLGVHAGVTDLRVLAILLGVGQLVVLAVAWSAAIVLVRSSPPAYSVVVLAAGLCAGSTWMFSNAESTLGAAFTILVAALLWLPRSWRWGDALVALACALVLVKTHETIVLTSALIAPWAALRAVGARSRLERYACRGVALLALVTIAHGVVELVRQRDNPPAHDLVRAVRSLEPFELYAGLVASALLFVLLYVPLRPAVRLALVGLAAVAGLAVLWGSFVTDGEAYRARGGAMLTVLVATAALLGLWARTRAGRGELRGPASPALAVWLTVGVALIPLVAIVPRAERWSRSLDAFRSAAVSRTGIVPVNDVLPPDRREVLFDWTSSSLSVVVRDGSRSAVLVDPTPSYVPFPPSEAQRQIPDRYAWR